MCGSKVYFIKENLFLTLQLCFRFSTPTSTLHIGIIPLQYVAGVTRDGKFSGSMINESTQVVFMDEWTNDSLCCEDAKRLL